MTPYFEDNGPTTGHSCHYWKCPQHLLGHVLRCFVRLLLGHRHSTHRDGACRRKVAHAAPCGTTPGVGGRGPEEGAAGLSDRGGGQHCLWSRSKDAGPPGGPGVQRGWGPLVRSQNAVLDGRAGGTRHTRGSLGGGDRRARVCEHAGGVGLWCEAVGVQGCLVTVKVSACV